MPEPQDARAAACASTAWILLVNKPVYPLYVWALIGADAATPVDCDARPRAALRGPPASRPPLAARRSNRAAARRPRRHALRDEAHGRRTPGQRPFSPPACCWRSSAFGRARRQSPGRSSSSSSWRSSLCTDDTDSPGRSGRPTRRRGYPSSTSMGRPRSQPSSGSASPPRERRLGADLRKNSRKEDRRPLLIGAEGVPARSQHMLLERRHARSVTQQDIHQRGRDPGEYEPGAYPRPMTANAIQTSHSKK